MNSIDYDAVRAKIKHVFVLMLENRSFDQMLGNEPGAGADYRMPPNEGDPPHEFTDVLRQLTGASTYTPPDYPEIRMNPNDFIVSYSNKRPPPANSQKILNQFHPRQLPVLRRLAKEFAVCDHWFSSMPGPTWPNRFFVHAATSGDLDDSPSNWNVVTSNLVVGYRFDDGTIYESLNRARLNWRIYAGDEFPQSFSLHGMTREWFKGRFRRFSQFRNNLHNPYDMPSYVFIEPAYYGGLAGLIRNDMTDGNSQHPLNDVTYGEQCIKDVYEAIRNSPLWEKCLLVITYDEHGGFYDKVAPGRTVPPNYSSRGSKHNFDFSQLGVRVPAVVISPHIPKGFVDRTPYDHSSILASVEKLFDLPALTQRDGGANDFLHLCSLDKGRDTAPDTLPFSMQSYWRRGIGAWSRFLFCLAQRSKLRRGPVGEGVSKDAPISPLTRGFMHVAFLRHLAITAGSSRIEALDTYISEAKKEPSAEQITEKVRELSLPDRDLTEEVIQPFLRIGTEGTEAEAIEYIGRVQRIIQDNIKYGAFVF